MTLNVQQKQLDASTLCPLCRAAMFWTEAEHYDQEVNFYECSSCQHRIFPEQQLNCHCEQCSAQRKKLLKESRLQEQRKLKPQDAHEFELRQLSFMQKLFLLALLDEMVHEHTAHQEFIDWEQIKYRPITPNYLFQNAIIKHLVKEQILICKDFAVQAQQYYVNVRLDGYSEPSLYSITHQLRAWFYENLSLGVPFKTSDEVKDAVFTVLYQEVIQFMQFYCRMWGVQIAGNKSFRTFCYQLMDGLAVGQIYYLVQTALEYLHQQNALQPRNENFINTNLLKKTLQQYRERSISEKWETSTLPRPHQMPLSKMSEILFFRFLGYDERIFFQPVWRSWKKIEPRLSFYSNKRCMHCGSEELSVDYDAADYVTLFCRKCKHQDHYFTR